jgi:hypothetical protein
MRRGANLCTLSGLLIRVSTRIAAVHGLAHVSRQAQDYLQPGAPKNMGTVVAIFGDRGDRFSVF